MRNTVSPEYFTLTRRPNSQLVPVELKEKRYELLVNGHRNGDEFDIDIMFY